MSEYSCRGYDAQREPYMAAPPDDNNLFQFLHELPIAPFG
jgi:hypothetical protein